ncbi:MULTISPECIES: hypothetical protein [unclassified Kutzneria]|nr:hypothetical protein [Kutzneria sp. 744]
MSENFRDFTDVLEQVYQEQDALDAADERLVTGLRVAVDGPAAALRDAA